MFITESYNNNNINASHLYCAHKCKTNLKAQLGHCTSEKRMTSILRHAAEAFPPVRQGTIPNSHQVIGIGTNTSMVLYCALVTYIMMTADVGLPRISFNVIPPRQCMLTDSN